jgi:hypothetical protein
MSRVRIALLLALALSGCGGGEDGEPRASSGDWREHADERRGFRVSLPPGWHRAERSLSPTIVDPVEILLVASFPVDESRGLCRTIADIPPDEALVTIQERGRGAAGQASFPPRPEAFEPDPKLPGGSTWPYCLDGDHRAPIPIDDYWFGFGDAGRAFHVLVGLGKEAPPQLSEEAFAILDTLRFDPEAKPDWPASG